MFFGEQSNKWERAERITSKDNRWVKEYVRLAGSKSHREETGLFAVESVKLVREAGLSDAVFRMIFITETCLRKRGGELEELLEREKFSIISEELESKLSLTKTPQGIYAVCEKLDKRLSMDTILNNGKYVLLAGLQDTGNVGTIIRTAEALGIDGVLLTADTCDPYHPKVIRGSMGSVFRMPFAIVPDLPARLESWGEAGVQTCASVLDEGAVSLDRVTFREPSVLLIGNEGNGLENQIAAACTERITIPMRGKTESLNASMAACILMWEMGK